jgi:6-phosphofructokinase 2
MPRFVTFTPNPALDVSTAVDHLVEAHKMRCEAASLHPGGGGINVARVLHRLGAEVLAVYPCGGPTGERLHGLLQDEGVPGLRLPVRQETRESFTVLERGSGREYRFVLPGPTLEAAEWRGCLDRLASSCTPPAWLVSSGSLPPGVNVDGHAQVARMARALGVRMVVDTSGPALAAALQAGVWLVKPSLRELSELAGQPLPTLQAQREAARRLITEGQARMVALSLGGQGALLVTASECLQADALPVPIASSVGAGDSFLAALVCSLDRGEEAAQALAHAVAAGAAAVMSAGTALCERSDVERLCRQVQVRDC